jgi:DNA-binding NtrC family response regulator
MPSPAVLPLGGRDPVRILLLADLATVRLTLKAVLEKSGFLVDIAGTPAEAERRITEGRFALILCDLRGHENSDCKRLLELARSQSYHPATALLSVNSESDTLGDAAEEMLIETVDVPELLTQIAELIGQRRARRAARLAG